MTDQPLGSTCIKPYFGLLWHNDCGVNMPGYPTEVDDIKINLYNTIFNVKGKQYDCRNLYNFQECCGGNGPVPTGSKVDYIDKLCACRITETNSVKNTLYKIKGVVDDIVYSKMYAKAIKGLIFIFMFPKFSAVILIVIMWISYASGSCELNDMMPLPAVSKNYNKDISWPVRVRMTKGDYT